MKIIKNILLCVFYACSSALAGSEEEPNSLLEKYSDRYVGYTLSYNPTDWEFSSVNEE